MVRKKYQSISLGDGEFYDSTALFPSLAEEEGMMKMAD